jgi:hypothetical protein
MSNCGISFSSVAFARLRNWTYESITVEVPLDGLHQAACTVLLLCPDAVSLAYCFSRAQAKVASRSGKPSSALLRYQMLRGPSRVIFIAHSLHLFGVQWR